MLTIQMPEGHDKKKGRSLTRRRWEALGYVVAAGLIFASIYISFDSPHWWWVAVLVEAWWFWAAASQDWEK